MDPDEWMDYIRENCPQIEVDGEDCYVVEKDLLIPGNQLQAYAESLANLAAPAPPDGGEADRLVVATLLNGKRMRWVPGTVLTWTFDEDSFTNKDWLELARSFCAEAANDWNDAAKEKGISDRISFAHAASGEDPVFKFSFHPFPKEPNLLALAFYPIDAPPKRTVFIGPKVFEAGLPFDQTGVIRHELGHVLGFRHEHIRPEAMQGLTPAQKAGLEQWVAGGMGAAELTKFDRQSVMLYPQFGNGDGKFRLSAADKAGFGELYSAPSDPAKIKECYV